MATATKPAKVKEKLTLRDSVDLYQSLNTYVEDHIDEIELNGGALPDDLAKILDEIDAATADRVDAIGFKLDELKGYAASATATKDRAARREKVWTNAIAAMKAYAAYQLERSGEEKLKGAMTTLRFQNNSAPSTELTAPIDSHQALLLSVYDIEERRVRDLQFCEAMRQEYGEDWQAEHPILPAHGLAKFITVQRVAMLDKKALGAAYEARRKQLEEETQLLSESDITDADWMRIADFVSNADGAENMQAIAVREVLKDMRAKYIADNLATEFPGVRCERGHHLRID